MAIYVIILAGAVVILAIAVFGIWFANYRGRLEGSASLRVDIANKAAEDANKAGKVLAEHREPGDAAGRLESGTF